jgi:hypothetical protein
MKLYRVMVSLVVAAENEDHAARQVEDDIYDPTLGIEAVSEMEQSPKEYFGSTIA